MPLIAPVRDPALIIETHFVAGTTREQGREFLAGELHERLDAAARYLKANPHPGARVVCGETATDKAGEWKVLDYLALQWPETAEEFEQAFGSTQEVPACP